MGKWEPSPESVRARLGTMFTKLFVAWSIQQVAVPIVVRAVAFGHDRPGELAGRIRQPVWALRCFYLPASSGFLDLCRLFSCDAGCHAPLRLEDGSGCANISGLLRVYMGIGAFRDGHRVG